MGSTVDPARPQVADRSSRQRFTRAFGHVTFGVAPVLVLFALLLDQLYTHTVAVDFHAAYYPAAERLLHGISPYATTAVQMARHEAFVYPAPAAFMFVPFALLGDVGGEALYVLFCVLCVPAALRVLDVRDWRLYGISLLWLPVFSGWQTANVTLPLVLLSALAWRYRARAGLLGLLTVLAICLKPIAWPLVIWLLATRRFRATVWTCVWGVLIGTGSFAVVGFGQIVRYLHLSSVDSHLMWHDGYSLVAAAYHLGCSRLAGELALVVVALAGVVLIWRLGSRGLGQRGFAAAILLMVASSPLVWSHYFALLLVPLALARPRLSAAWAAPVLMWVCPPSVGVRSWQLVVAWAVTAVVASVLLRTRGPADLWEVGRRALVAVGHRARHRPVPSRQGRC